MRLRYAPSGTPERISAGFPFRAEHANEPLSILAIFRAQNAVACVGQMIAALAQQRMAADFIEGAERL